MANITYDTDDVLSAGGGNQEHRRAGESLGVGVPVYVDATGKVKAADAGAATAAEAAATHITLTAAAEGQPITIQRGGRIDYGADVFTPGVAYVVADGGGIAPIEDLAEEDVYLTLVGAAATSSLLLVAVLASGSKVPVTPPPPPEPE